MFTADFQPNKGLPFVLPATPLSTSASGSCSQPIGVPHHDTYIEVWANDFTSVHYPDGSFQHFYIFMDKQYSDRQSPCSYFEKTVAANQHPFLCVPAGLAGSLVVVVVFDIIQLLQSAGSNVLACCCQQQSWFCFVSWTVTVTRTHSRFRTGSCATTLYSTRPWSRTKTTCCSWSPSTISRLVQRQLIRAPQ